MREFLKYILEWKEPGYTIIFSQKFRQANPLRVHQWGPYGESCLYPEPFLTHWGRGHLNCLNAHSRGF